MTENEMVRCRNCEDGQWYTECCNGSGGCSCGGGIVPMGRCRVCNGTGWHEADADTTANLKAIQGFGYIGSGPRGGGIGNPPAMGAV